VFGRRTPSVSNRPEGKDEFTGVNSSDGINREEAFGT
jgi:hypothetical protein